MGSDIRLDSRGSSSGHATLHAILERLGGLCAREEGAMSCTCSPLVATACTERLLDCVGDLLVEVVDHLHQESRLRQSLSGSQQTASPLLERLHRDHEALSALLADYASRIDETNPRAGLLALRNLLRSWLAEHLETHAQLDSRGLSLPTPARHHAPTRWQHLSL